MTDIRSRAGTFEEILGLSGGSHLDFIISYLLVLSFWLPFVALNVIFCRRGFVELRRTCPGVRGTTDSRGWMSCLRVRSVMSVKEVAVWSI